MRRYIHRSRDVADAGEAGADVATRLVPLNLLLGNASDGWLTRSPSNGRDDGHDGQPKTSGSWSAHADQDPTTERMTRFELATLTLAR